MSWPCPSLEACHPRTVVLVIPTDPLLDLATPGEPHRVMASCLAGLDDRPVTIHHDGTQRGLEREWVRLAGVSTTRWARADVLATVEDAAALGG